MKYIIQREKVISDLDGIISKRQGIYNTKNPLGPGSGSRGVSVIFVHAMMAVRSDLTFLNHDAFSEHTENAAECFDVLIRRIIQYNQICLLSFLYGSNFIVNAKDL